MNDFTESAPTGQVSVNDELTALQACVEALEAIDHDEAALRRVIRYLSDRYGDRS